MKLFEEILEEKASVSKKEIDYKLLNEINELISICVEVEGFESGLTPAEIEKFNKCLLGMKGCAGVINKLYQKGAEI